MFNKYLKSYAKYLTLPLVIPIAKIRYYKYDREYKKEELYILNIKISEK